MAEFNSCSKLVTENKDLIKKLQEDYSQRLPNDEYVKEPLESPFANLMKIQAGLQKMYANKHKRSLPPDELQTKGQLVDFLYDMKIAIDDEFRELIEAVHGMSRPESERSACWKKWKGDYDKIRSEKINENLNDDDLIERNMEMVDIMHFVINMLLALGIDEETLFALYHLKNKENYNRQNNNY